MPAVVPPAVRVRVGVGVGILVGVLALAGVACAPGTPDRTATPSTSTATTARRDASAAMHAGDRRPGPAGTPIAAAEALDLGAAGSPAHLRLFVLGDSVAFTLTDAFERAVERLDTAGVPSRLVGVMAQPGFGVTADVPGRMRWSGADPDVEVPPAQWYAGWPLRVGASVEEGRPNVVVVLLGAWDAIPRRVDGEWLRPGTRAWHAWLTDRIDTTNEILTANGAQVAWLELTCIADEVQRERLRLVAEAVDAAAARRPETVTTLDLDEVACPSGEYDPLFHHAGDAVPLRMDDGVHFDGGGAGAAIAPWLAEQLRALVDRAA